MAPAAIASLVAMTSYLTAADSNSAQMRNLENRVHALETKKNANGMINPPARPMVNNGWGFGFNIDGELLLWQAHENGLGFVIEDKPASGLLAGADSTLKRPDFEWNWGFRVGAGFDLPHDNWDVNLTWTWMRGHANRQISANAEHSLVPTRGHPAEIGASTVTKAKDSWSVKLNVLDLDMGRDFYVSKYVTFRPFVGLRTAWIRQKLDNHYRGLSNGLFEYEVNDRCKYWGLGLLAGLDSQFTIGQGVSVYGKAAISLLNGFFSVKKDESSVATSSSAEVEVIDLSENDRVGRAITDLQLGLRYDVLFYQERYRLGFALGWEHHMFFGQNQFIQFASATATGVEFANQGDLTFQGWTFAANFEF